MSAFSIELDTAAVQSSNGHLSTPLIQTHQSRLFNLDDSSWFNVELYSGITAWQIAAHLSTQYFCSTSSTGCLTTSWWQQDFMKSLHHCQEIARARNSPPGETGTVQLTECSHLYWSASNVDFWLEYVVALCWPQTLIQDVISPLATSLTCRFKTSVPWQHSTFQKEPSRC